MRAAPPSPTAILLLVCLLLWCVACGPSDDGAAAPLGPAALAGQDCVVIVLDATHADHLSCYGADDPVSPVIDALAARGVRFERAWSNSSWTLPSTASLFTGLYEQTHGVRDPDKALDPAAGTMAECFAGAGYATASFIQNPYAGDRHGLDRGFEQLDMEHVRRDTELADRAAGFLNDRTDGRPHFAYVHFRRPHAPYDPSDEGRQRFVDAAYEGPVTGAASDIEDHNTKRQPLGPKDVRHLEDLYRANLSDIDRTVGRLVDAIDTERTLVVVLSDHGEAFNQHDMLGHNWRSFEEFVHVPLVLAHPRLAPGHVVGEAAQTLDLLPTLIELFDLTPPPQPLAGRSQVAALAGGRGAERQGVFTSSRIKQNGGFWLAVSDGRYKLLVELPEGREFLFDLHEDPAERINLIDAQPQRVKKLRASLDDWIEASRTAALIVTDSQAADEETLQRLRELGYLEGR